MININDTRVGTAEYSIFSLLNEESEDFAHLALTLHCSEIHSG